MYSVALMLIGLVCGWSIPSQSSLRHGLPGVTAWSVLTGLVTWCVPAALPGILIGVATGIAGSLLLRHVALRRIV